MVKVLLDDIAKVLSGVDQRHRGLVDAPAEFTWSWSGRTGGAVELVAITQSTTRPGAAGRSERGSYLICSMTWREQRGRG